MKKVMISQPMKGRSNEEIIAEREPIVKELLKKGYETINTVFAESPEEAQNAPVWYLSKSIEAMSTVDAVYFMDGWEEARGCKLERQIAEAYGITILSLYQNLI